MDELDVLLDIFKSWRDDNPDYLRPDRIEIEWDDEVSGSCQLFYDQIDTEFDLRYENEGGRDIGHVTALKIVFGGLDRQPMKIAVGELGNLQRLESLSISASYGRGDNVQCPLHIEGQFPFGKLPRLKTLQMNFFTIDVHNFRAIFEKFLNDEEYIFTDTPMIETFPRHGLPADKLRGIGNLSRLETLHLAGVQSGIDSSILSEIRHLTNLRDLELINCDSESEAWNSPTEEQVLALLQVTAALPQDVQGIILERVRSGIPCPRMCTWDEDYYDEDTCLPEELFGNKVTHEEYRNNLIHARKTFSKLEKFDSRYFVAQKDVDPVFKAHHDKIWTI